MAPVDLQLCLSRLETLLAVVGRQLHPRESTLGRYEADSTAFALTYLVHGHGQSALLLGRAGASHYPAAAVIARAAFETAALAAWLMVPDDPFQREGRWLGYYVAHERSYRKIADDLEPVSPDLSAGLRKSAAAFEAWRCGITQLLPPHVKVVPRPTFFDILRELNYVPHYSAYREFSQVIHAEPNCIPLVRSERASPSEPVAFGPRASVSTWASPLRVLSWSLAMSTLSVMPRIEAQPFQTLALQRAARQLLQAVDDFVKHA